MSEHSNESSTNEQSLVVEVGTRGAKASVPPKLFVEIGPVLKYSILILSFAGAIAMVLSALALVVKAWQ